MKRNTDATSSKVIEEIGNVLDPRAWLFNGGGGFDDNDLRGHTYTGYGLVDMLEAYRDDLIPEDCIVVKKSELAKLQEFKWKYEELYQ